MDLKIIKQKEARHKRVYTIQIHPVTNGDRNQKLVASGRGRAQVNFPGELEIFYILIWMMVTRVYQDSTNCNRIFAFH